MEKNTKDNRNFGISSNEEYEEALKRLKYYKDEYLSVSEIANQEEKIKEIDNEARNIRPMLNTDSFREQRYYLTYYNKLKRKKDLISSEKYKAFLKDNMRSILCLIRQYEIDSKDYTLISMIVGILKNDKELLRDIRDSRMLSRIRIWHGVPKEEDLALQKPEEILEYIDKHCNLVGIKIPEKSEDKSLLPVVSDGYLPKEQKQLNEIVDKYIYDDDIESKEGVVTQSQEKEHKEEEGKDTIELREVKQDKERENEPGIVIEKISRDIVRKRKSERDISKDKGDFDR